MPVNFMGATASPRGRAVVEEEVPEWQYCALCKQSFSQESVSRCLSPVSLTHKF